jgi:hypothetical protein
MAIAIVASSTEYGKQRQDGNIRPLSELTADQDEAFAHSMEDAIKWVRSLPAFKDAETVAPNDGRIFFYSQWAPADWIWALDKDLPEAQATHQRTVIGIATRNTIFEDVGYEMYRAA